MYQSRNDERSFDNFPYKKGVLYNRLEKNSVCYRGAKGGDSKRDPKVKFFMANTIINTN